MDLTCKVQSYLSGASAVVDSLSEMVCCKELENCSEVMHKIIITMLEFEQSTADFISDMELNRISMHSVTLNKRCFIKSNERIIEHLKKIQLQGYNFEELTTALKLEIQTLMKEIDFL